MLDATSRISVIAMTGAAIAIDDASPTDTILTVKERVFAVNRQFHVRRQRLMYRPGPRGMDALADDETLGGAGVARDGTAELDVLVADLTDAEVAELGGKVWLWFEKHTNTIVMPCGFYFCHQIVIVTKSCKLC